MAPSSPKAPTQPGINKYRVAAILRQQLQDDGVPADAIGVCLDEMAAVRDLLTWAQAGDVLVLPTHGVAARHAARALLDSLEAQGWQPGLRLPPV